MYSLLFRGIPLFLLPVFLISGEPSSGTRSIALGGANVALGGDVWSTTHNPALLGLSSGFSGAVVVIPQRYGMSELRTLAVAGRLSVSFGGIGCVAEQFGFDLYRETNVSAGSGVLVGEFFSLGISLTAKHLSIERYGTRWLALTGIGLAARPLDEVVAGAAVQNLLNAGIGRLGERLPQILSWGIAWAPEEVFLLSFEIEKDTRYPATMRVGMERSFLGIFLARIGLSSPPAQVSAGAAVVVWNIEAGFAGRFHTELGWIHGMEVAWRIGQ